MMFASKTPRDLIRTPEDDALIAAGDFCEEEVYGLTPSKFHNTPNLILVEFRKRVAEAGEHTYGSGEYVSMMEHLEFMQDFPDLGHTVEAMHDHARRVLTRLPSLEPKGASNDHR